MGTVHELPPEGADLWYGDAHGRVRLREEARAFVAHEAYLCPAPTP